MIDTATFLQLDLPAMLAGVLSALACGLLGNILLLRRQALIGDAISHVVLPGIVAGFLLFGTVATMPMLGGAALAALVAVGLIELVRRIGRLESGAAMGVVFTTMFAAGIVLLEQTPARDVHIDVQHSLYGNIEGTVWLAASGWADLLDPVALAMLPASLWRLLAVNLAVAAFLAIFYKEIKVTTFDPGLAESLGISTRWIGLALMVMTALAAVAAFEAVGSILVIAMFVCPAATARLLTDRLGVQIALSAVFAVAAGIAGYVAAAFVPMWFGMAYTLGVAGMIAVVSGLMLAAAIVFAPVYGTLARRGRGTGALTPPPAP